MPHAMRPNARPSMPRRLYALTAALLALALSGCGGGGGGGGSSSPSHPSGFALPTPSFLTGTTPSGLTVTFSESLATLANAPAVTFTLEETNTGAAPVTIPATQDPTTHDLYPAATVQVLDPQARPVTLPPGTLLPADGSKTLTLNPGDTDDVTFTVNLATFPQTGRYTVTLSSPSTQGVPALAQPLALTAN